MLVVLLFVFCVGGDDDADDEHCRFTRLVITEVKIVLIFRDTNDNYVHGTIRVCVIKR